MNIIFAAYRDWAVNVLPTIQSHPKIDHVTHVKNIEELEALVATPDVSDNNEFVMLCGWSWQVSRELLSKITVISEHPAFHDEYSLGTPLQNQIIDGFSSTSHRVVKIGYPELGERLYSPLHDVPMSLEGNMDDILLQMEVTARDIYTRFLNDYPNFTWAQWPVAASYRVPRKPPDSELKNISSMTTQEIYDHIRMLGDPYPNAFIEDEHGKLYFNRVTYEPK